MKKTISANIGGNVFILDEDAYRLLDRYLKQIESRLSVAIKKDTLNNIEDRIASLFSASITPRRQVVDISLVRDAISMIGQANEFGESFKSCDCDSEYTAPAKDPKSRKLYRSRSKKVFGGVCGGLSDYFGWDIAAVRLATFFIIFFTGVLLFAYIVCWMVIPLEPWEKYENEMNAKREYYEC